MNDIEMIKALTLPAGKVDAVLDTDAYNEIDDQFAIAYMLRSDEKINVKEIYAAPFYNENSTSPEDGMVKSYGEIEHILKLMGREDMIAKTFEGSRGYMPDEKTPVDSPAATALIKLSQNYDANNRLYVVAIGAITNVASALVADPTLKDRIVVVWLGGHAINWYDTREFNMEQDVAAARVVFGCGVPFVQLPCMGVVSAFSVTAPELDHYLTGKTPVSTYLAENTIRYLGGREKFWSKTIWDVTAVGWLLNDNCRFMHELIVRAPMPEYDDRYALRQDSHLMKYVPYINRDALMKDLFDKLTRN